MTGEQCPAATLTGRYDDYHSGSGSLFTQRRVVGSAATQSRSSEPRSCAPKCSARLPEGMRLVLCHEFGKRALQAAPFHHATSHPPTEGTGATHPCAAVMTRMEDFIERTLRDLCARNLNKTFTPKTAACF